MNETKNMPTAQGGGRKFRNDVIFIGVLLVLVVLVGLGLLLFRREGDAVTVTVDKQVIGTYSLAEDRTVEIRTGAEGKELNLLVIRNREAYVESATCPDGICAFHKPISRNGESIVCLPHRVVVTVVTEDGEGPDVIA